MIVLVITSLILFCLNVKLINIKKPHSCDAHYIESEKYHGMRGSSIISIKNIYKCTVYGSLKNNEIRL